MTESHDLNDVQSLFTDERALEWMEEHLPELKRFVSGQRLLYQSLVIGFVIGLAAHVGGYFLLASTPNGFLGLLADLLHALGWSLPLARSQAPSGRGHLCPVSKRSPSRPSSTD